MIARNAETVDVIEQRLRDHHVPVQRLISSIDGLEAGQIAGDDDRSTFPLGMVIVTDISSWRSTMEAMQINRAAQAAINIIAASRQGSTVDHVMIVTPEHAAEAASTTLHRIIDRMAEARIAESVTSSGHGFLSEEALSSLIGDHVLLGESAERLVYGNKGEDGRDFDKIIGTYPSGGFDHRSANEAFNVRQSRRRRG